jgi:hypothetical protein
MYGGISWKRMMHIAAKKGKRDGTVQEARSA